MHAISSYRGNRPTNRQTIKQTNKQADRQDRLQHTVPLSLVRSVKMNADNMEFAGIHHKLHKQGLFNLNAN